LAEFQQPFMNNFKPSNVKAVILARNFREELVRYVA